MPAIGDIVYSIKSKRQHLYEILEIKDGLATIQHVESKEKYYYIPLAILKVDGKQSFLCRYCHTRQAQGQESPISQVCKVCFETLPSCEMCKNKAEHIQIVKVRGLPDSPKLCLACIKSLYRCEDCLIFHKSASPKCSSCHERNRFPESRGYRRTYNYVPEKFTFYAQTENDTSPYLGVELECANVLHLRDNDLVSWELYKKSNGFLYSVFDSSINATRVGDRNGDGIELVSHPATYLWWKGHKEIVQDVVTLKDQGFRSYNARLCGMHVHINRSSFTQKQLVRFLYLFFGLYKFWAHLSEKGKPALDRYASGRNWDDSVLDLVSKNTTQDIMGSRYKIVNVTRNTVEVRHLRGALNEDYFYKNLELVMAAFDFANTTLSITEKDFVNFVVKNHNKYPLFYRFMVLKLKDYTKKIQALLPTIDVSPIVIDSCA